jgi:hypothetical protein
MFLISYVSLFFQGVIQVDDVYLVGVMLVVVELSRVLEWWDAEKG